MLPWTPVVENTETGCSIKQRSLPPCSVYAPSVPETDAPDVSRDLEVADFAWSVSRVGDSVVARQITVYHGEEESERWMVADLGDGWSCEAIAGDDLDGVAIYDWPATALDDIGNVALGQSEFASRQWMATKQGGDRVFGTAGTVSARVKNVVALVAVYTPGDQAKGRPQTDENWVSTLSAQARPTIELMANFAK